MVSEGVELKRSRIKGVDLLQNVKRETLFMYKKENNRKLHVVQIVQLLKESQRGLSLSFFFLLHFFLILMSSSSPRFWQKFGLAKQNKATGSFLLIANDNNEPTLFHR
jgi:hypothetical protein